MTSRPAAHLLVTTSFSVLDVDIETSTVRPIHRGKGLYYGIAQSPTTLFVACRNRMVSTGGPIQDERGEILMFDHSLVPYRSLSAPFPMRDMHEIAWHDGVLLATCSFDNFIAIWDGADWDRWYPTPEDRDASHDIHHYNSFRFTDEGLWLLAHNNEGPSELLLFERPHSELIRRVSLGVAAHNVWLEGDEIFTFSSAEGLILGDKGFRFVTGGFPRGYATLPSGERFVGIGEASARAKRDLMESRIVMYDSAWRETETFSLPDEGMVLDIRVLEKGFDRRG